MILQNRQGIHVGLAFLVSACATHAVELTSYTPVVQDSQDVPEDFMDVGVSCSTPASMSTWGMMKTNPEIRVAESRYAPFY